MKRLFIFCGLSLAGKTTLAALFISRGCVGLETEEPDLSPGIEQESNPNSIRALLHALERHMKSGRDIVIDGMNGSRQERDLLREAALNGGYQPMVVWVRTPVEEIQRRRSNQREGDDSEMLGDDTFQNIQNFFEPPGDDESVLIPPGDQWPDWVERQLSVS